MAFIRMRRDMRRWLLWCRARSMRRFGVGECRLGCRCTLEAECRLRQGDEMKILVRGLLVACVSFGSVMVQAQAAPAAATAPAVDTAKEIASMQAKLADWPQLRRYREANAALAPVAAGEQRVVFYGDSITDGWGRLPNAGVFFPGKPYVSRGVS